MPQTNSSSNHYLSPLLLFPSFCVYLIFLAFLSLPPYCSILCIACFASAWSIMTLLV
ncbi:hypothetical protein BCR44DRAFT_1027635 [Catenaria anguillulae PL171]|uniref:Uncharacterized protein n=1 Tax=Catenaria anguillulae PL171 TaxID=765915 RepID=A0A1Y2HXK5_9FUNG|nr:hypothetical protein BCR44DRAFT_1027635 [Catenaria anguillulae PL171]